MPPKSASEKVIALQNFDMSSIPPNKKILFVGGTNSGKTILCLDYLYYHQSEFPIGTLLSPSEPFNETYKNHIPAVFIHNEYTPELIQSILERQKEITQNCKSDPRYVNVNPLAFCIMDDCLADSKKWKNDENIRWIFENGRHVNLTLLMTMQYALGIPPHLRANIQYIFLCRTPKYQEQKKLFEQYAGMFESFKQFREVFSKCTKKYGCMVINNEARSDNLEEQVFKYKANPDNKPDWDTFRMCYPSFWKDNDKCRKIKQIESEKTSKLLPIETNKKYVVHDDDDDDD